LGAGAWERAEFRITRLTALPRIFLSRKSERRPDSARLPHDRTLRTKHRCGLVHISTCVRISALAGQAKALFSSSNLQTIAFSRQSACPHLTSEGRTTMSASAKIVPEISFLPIPTPTIPLRRHKPDTDEPNEQLENILKRVAADAPPNSSVFTASACGSDHHVHVYYGVHDATTHSSILLGEVTTEVLC
jgi:hypothetical protein